MCKLLEEKIDLKLLLQHEKEQKTKHSSKIAALRGKTSIFKMRQYFLPRNIHSSFWDIPSVYSYTLCCVADLILLPFLYLFWAWRLQGSCQGRPVKADPKGQTMHVGSRHYRCNTAAYILHRWEIRVLHTHPAPCRGFGRHQLLLSLQLSLKQTKRPAAPSRRYSATHQNPYEQEQAVSFHYIRNRKKKKKTPHLYCFLPIVFMVQVVITVCTVAVIAEFTICKTIAVPETEDRQGICKHDCYLGVTAVGSTRHFWSGYHAYALMTWVTLCWTPHGQGVCLSWHSDSSGPQSSTRS